MKRTLILSSALIVLLLMPGLVMATHITVLEGDATCEGWTAELGMVFRLEVFEADVDFTIVLLNSEAMELERYEYSGVLTREPDSPNELTYSFSGEWQDTHYSDSMIVLQSFHVAAMWEGEIEESFADLEIGLACTVGNEKSTWGSIKGLYR